MNEIVLERGVPLLVTPTTTTVVQNLSTTSDDPIFVSTSGVLTEKWMKIDAEDFIKFNTPMYFLQNSWNQLILPVVEHP